MNQPANDTYASRPRLRAAHNLPAALTAFVGRDAERAQVRDRLREPVNRLLTITGAGGVGKTRLALEAARSLAPGAADGSPFPHGVYLVPLASQATSELSSPMLATTIASALGLALSGVEAPPAQVAQYLREKSLLLLLDNFEHALAGAGLVTGLLQEAPALKILVTSRERLNVRGERVIELSGLRFPEDQRPAVTMLQRERESTPDIADLARYDAIQLFLRIAQAVDPGFELTDETAPAVVRICRLVEGLPLGIELAAAWMRMLTCDEIAQEIAQNIDFLTSTTPDLPTRQQSLRAVFDYSWNLLNDVERQALRQLAVFRGSFTREAAGAMLVINTPEMQAGQPGTHRALSQAELLALLTALVDKSLVQRTATGATARYEVLDLLRQYAAEQLERAGEAAAVAARHAAFYAAWMAERTAELRGPQQQAALEAIGAEIAQIRAAWRQAVAQADGATIGRMADSLFHFYDMRSWFQEGAEAFSSASRALAAAQDEGARLVYGKVLARYGWFTFYLGQQAPARDLLEQSLAIMRRLDARAEMIFALNYLGAVYSYLGEYDRTRVLCQESLALADALGDLYGRAIASNILGQAAYELGEYAAARGWHEQSLAAEQRTGNRWSMAFSQTNMGKVAYALREYDEARRLFEQSLRTRQEAGDVRGVALNFNRLGDIAVAQGDLAEAGRRYAQSLALSREIGSQWGMAAALLNLGRLAATQKRDTAAARLLQEALRLALNTQSVPQAAQILAAFAPVVRRGGEAALADELARLAAAEPATLDRCRSLAERLLARPWPGSDPSLSLDEAIQAAQQPAADVAPTPPAPAAFPASAAAYPAGLTAREVAVLRLVAEGLTDAQVAERLIVSPRTVSTHLTSIYGKLGVNSRSAATRFAVEHGLL
jgi:predicted ATPase/DNA-binding CsgD family transcriptional regulator